MEIRVLGPGCENCTRLEANVQEALNELGVEAALFKVTNYAEIAGYGVLSTPGLVIDDEVVVSGRVPSTAEVRDLLAGRGV